MFPVIRSLQDVSNLKTCSNGVHAGYVDCCLGNTRLAVELLVDRLPSCPEKAVGARWVQMDFKDTDSKGNFALKHYHENYGYDLAAVLSKHPIKELDNNSHKDDLMNSLKKGNLQSATFIKDGQEVKQYLEATPQFKTLTVYDADMKRLDTRQAKEQGQSQGTGEGKGQDSKKQQSATDEDGPGETQEKKQRRKKQSL